MGILDFFRGVDVISPQDARQLLQEQPPPGIQLVDVRSEKEYANGHLPGTRHIPVDQLENRLNELDADKTTIAY